MATTSPPPGWLLSKRQMLTSADEDVKKLELSAGGMQNAAVALEENLAAPQKVRRSVTIWTRNATPR